VDKGLSRKHVRLNLAVLTMNLDLAKRSILCQILPAPNCFILDAKILGSSLGTFFPNLPSIVGILSNVIGFSLSLSSVLLNLGTIFIKG
jgi:hypothetical protein